jgi:hypothetical protein
MSLRVKKYFMLTNLSEPANRSEMPSSKGRRMLIPMLRSRPAPTLAASMIPGPAPVTTIQPDSASLPASTLACSYSGSLGWVRAEPNTVTFRTSS